LDLVLLAFSAAFLQNSVWPVIQHAGESQRQTILVQSAGAMVTGVHLLAVIFLWQLGILGLYAIFAAISVEYLLAAIVIHRRLQYAPTLETDSVDVTSKSMLQKYLGYCLPLIPYAWISCAYELTDRWLLQNYGGSVEQAYYAVGSQISAVALIATSSILPILWKEIAEAHHQGNHIEAGILYLKVSRQLFLVGAVIAGFLIPWAEDLLQIILGVAYVGGGTTLAIMFLYPVHQSMGQICGTMLLATERVSLQVVTGILFMIISMGVSYLILAPEDAIIPGLGLASEGLALKMVVLQLIQVNIVAYIISRIWKLPFEWVYQPVGLMGCVGLGWLVQFTVTSLVGQPALSIIPIGLSGLPYLLLIAAFVYIMPWLVGSTRNELILAARAIPKNMIHR
jgi:O-antigen/teichoic acid export membrane protein